MQTGHFKKRLSFNEYEFFVNDQDIITVCGNDAVILEYVEYDIYVNRNKVFKVYASRARKWCRELQFLFFPNMVKFHASSASIPHKTVKFAKWESYDFNEAMSELVLDRPKSARAVDLFKEHNWGRLVNEFWVSAECLSQYVPIDSKEVLHAFVIGRILRSMCAHSTAHLNTEQLDAVVLNQDRSFIKDELTSNGTITVDVSSATISLSFLKPTPPIKTPTYPSWHRFIKERTIPTFMFTPEAPDWSKPNRKRLVVEKRFDAHNNDLVMKAVFPLLKVDDSYVFVNCNTRALVVRHNASKQIGKLVKCEYETETYVFNGEMVPYSKSFSEFSNCHPCAFEDICLIEPNSTNLVLVVDKNTPQWVYMDAHFATRTKMLICVELKCNIY